MSNAAIFEQLVATIAALRAENGCPWDKRQTHGTLRPYLLEETYEVLDAIESNDMDALREELGDLLLQVILHAQLAAEESSFTITEVISDLNTKLIRRHPHVFGDSSARTEKEISIQWDEIKQQEKNTMGDMSRLSGVPESMPALFRALKLQKRAAKAGFDFPDIRHVLEKLDEEMQELSQERTSSPPVQKRLEEELGDILFSVVNLSRFLSINPELALQGANKRFLSRFQHMENILQMSKKDIESMHPDDLDLLWEHSKRALSANKEEIS